MIQSLEPWLRQPTTMVGLALIFSSVALALCGIISGEALVCILPSACGLIGFDDHTAFRHDAPALAASALRAAEGGWAGALPVVLEGAAKLAEDVTRDKSPSKEKS